VRVDSPASRNSKPIEVADTRIGVALPAAVLSVWAPLVELNGGMLETDGCRRFAESIDTRLASDTINSDGTVGELSARFEVWTSRGGGVCGGVYVIQGDAM
jgi:hypothetical protein